MKNAANTLYKFLIKHSTTLGIVIVLLFFYFALYKLYIPRINAFGCFDDCNNFLGGYFLLQGKRLFSEVFFNHNPLMAYVSMGIQYFTQPNNLHELILRHRQVVLLFGFLCNLGLIIRFKFPAVAFVTVYELTKFYLFGDRFLAEGFIVYPLIFLIGVAWESIQKRTIIKSDFLISSIAAWFILFMREPYVPVTIVLFAFIMWMHRKHSLTYVSIYILVILSLITIFMHDVGEFFYNVVITNIEITFLSEVRSAGLGGFSFLKIFTYPFAILYEGQWGYFRYVLIFLDILFLTVCSYLLMKKQWRKLLFVWLILGLVNIRYVIPGLVFYNAFHLLCWYAVFLFFSFTLLLEVFKHNVRLAGAICILYSAFIIVHVLSPASFVQEKNNQHEEFITNYGKVLQVGTVVNILSTPSNSLFIDGFDDMIYWQSKRDSSYKYVWYTSLMPAFDKYTDERLRMFRLSPPDFYYGSCPGEKDPTRTLPSWIKNEYKNVLQNGKPSCLWVKNNILKGIQKQQWEKAMQQYFTL